MNNNRDDQINNNVKLPDFAQLLDTDKVQNLMQKIADATGMGIAAVDYCGNPTAGHCGYSGYCSNVQKDPERKRACEASTGMGLIQAATKHMPYIYVCPFGQLEVSIPIIVDNVFMGGFVAGQIRCDEIPNSINRLELILPQKKDCKIMFREEREQTKRMTFDDFMTMANMVSTLLSELIEKSIKIELIKQEKNSNASRAEVQRLIADHEMAYMSMKMNRHFLINCLSSICNEAAIEGAVKTNEMAGMLVEFLWKMSEDEEEETWFICDEIRAINYYVNLQKQMFDFDFVTNVPEELQLQAIPSMILYPIVEYCIYCGIKYNHEKGTLKIEIAYEDDYVRILIRDNGLGLPYRELKALYPQIVEEYDFDSNSNDNSMQLIRKRLENLFDGDFVFNEEIDRDTGTVFTLKYPLKYSEGDLKYV